MHVLRLKTLIFTIIVHSVIVIVIKFLIEIRVETIVSRLLKSNFYAIILIHSKFLIQAVFCILLHMRLQNCSPFAVPYFKLITSSNSAAVLDKVRPAGHMRPAKHLNEVF